MEEGKIYTTFISSSLCFYCLLLSLVLLLVNNCPCCLPHFDFAFQVEDEVDEVNKTEFNKLEAKLGETNDS